MYYSGTLCWDCQRARLRKDLYCPWAWKFIPVDGWEATPTLVKSTGMASGSYLVNKCPLFIQDEPRRITQDEPRQIAKENCYTFSPLPTYVVDGKEWVNASELCRQYGIKVSTFYNRIRRGMTAEDAIKTPNKNEAKKRKISAFGETLTVEQWAKKTGIPASTIYDRLLRGDPVEIILEIKENGKYGRKNGGD